MLEKLFLTRTDSFVNANNILNSSQYGFRKKIVSGIRMRLVYFLIKKNLFDTVDYSISIKKLKYYGMRGVANDWIKSYQKAVCQF